MRKFVDLSGQTIGKWEVRSVAGKQGHKYAFVCRCLGCGRLKIVLGDNLRRGKTKNCIECKRTLDSTPELRKTRAYVSWRSAIQRTSNPANVGYQYYGGANPPVRMCDRWKSFRNFFADLGEREAGQSLSRILDQGDYEPGNAFWMTRAEQGLQQRQKRELTKWAQKAA